MTELQRLEISGIRIFKENNPQVINFEPLTLIIGANGTGKSTIIESLKFATIGKLQKEMITLPDVWGKEKIESKVKLNFNSFNENNYEVTLTPSISKSKNNRLSFQTGNCKLTTQPLANGMKSDYIKPTDIEKEIPKYFGVSPSIIENVIFCDQRQSCWPIDDKPPILKQKFDQFFNTEKYNDAIEALNDTKKNLSKEINKIDLELARQEQRMDSYQKHKDKKIELEGKLSFLHTEINEKQNLFNENKSKLEDYELIRPKIEEIKKKIKKKKTEKESESFYIENLLEKIHDLQPKDSLPSSIEYNSSDITSNKEKIDLSEKNLNKYNDLKIKFENEKKLIKEKVDKMHENLEEIQTTKEFYKHSVNEFIEKYETDDLEKILNEQSQFFEEEQNKFNDLKTQSKTEIEQKDSEITEIKINFEKEKLELSAAEISLKEKTKELKKIGQIDNYMLKEAEEKKNDSKKKLNDFLKSSKNLQEIEKEISQHKTDLSNIEAKKEELQKCEKKVEKINDANEKIIQANKTIHNQLEIIKKVLDNPNIESTKVQQIIEDKIKEFKQNNNFQLNKNLNEVSIRLETMKSYLEESENETKNAIEKIKKVFKIDKIDSYFNEYESIEMKLKEETQKLARLKNSENVYNDFKSKAKKIIKGNHSCPLCGKDFKSNEEFNDFIKNIDHFISNLPDEIKICESEIKNNENRFNELKQINDYVRIFKQNQEKKEKYENLIKEDQIKQENLKKQIEFNDKKLDGISKLKENVFHLNQALQQLKDAEIQKNEISSTIEDNLPSIDEIQRHVVQLREEYSSIMCNINELYKNGNQYINQKNIYENESNEADRSFNEIKEKIERRNELNKQIDEIQMLIINKKEKIDELNYKINEMSKDRKNLEIHYQKQIEEQEKKYDDARNEFQNCFLLVKQIKKSKEKLNEADSNDLSNQLKELKDQLEQKKEELKNVNETLFKQNQIFDKLKKEAETLEKDKVNLKFQQEYFQRLEKFESVNEELKRLKLNKLKELGELRKIDYSELKTATQELEKELIKLKTQEESYQSQYEEEDISMHVYESSFNIFNENQIQKSVIEKSQIDIERYKKELNRIILELHTKKMEEINNIIYNLWQNTYYGRDVDKISIRCEKEQIENDKNNGKVQYNYKVVMTKNDIEMDMSKCASAGQRMLASIIIRIALLQTFASNCKIIAFDEPTTNVDKMNVRSFAKELIDLFKFKDDSDFYFSDDVDDLVNQQKNLQIILISHDSEFVRLLNEEGMIENFYQIETVVEGNQSYSQIIQKKMNEDY